MMDASISYRVPYADTDQMGIVYYANYLVYFERSRNELLRLSGKSYQEIEADGLFFPVMEAHAEYLKPAVYDDVLEVRATLKWTQGSRFRIEYAITRAGEDLCTGYTIHCALNKAGQPRRVPAELAERAGLPPED